MSNFLDVPGITRPALDAALVDKITDPDSDTAGALNATYASELETIGRPARAALDEILANRVPAINMSAALTAYDKLLGPLTIGFGDSITEAGALPNTSGQGERSYFAQAAIQSNQRIKYYRNAGIAGNTVEQMWARIESDVIAFAPDRVLFMGGTNNMSQVDQTSCQSTIRLILDRLQSAGIWTAVVSITPQDSITQVARDRIIAHNVFLQDEAKKRGMVYIDLFSVVVDPNTGGFIAGYSTDGVHPSITGAQVMGAKVISTIFGRYPATGKFLALSNTDADNLATNGQFSTDAGADGIPDGWVQTVSAGNTISLATDTGVVGKAVVFNRTATTGSLQLTQNVTTGFSVGDQFELAAKFKTSGTSLVFSILAVCVDNAFTQLSIHRPVYSWSGMYGDYATAYIQGTVPAGTTKIQLYLQATSGTGTLSVGQLKLKNLTTAGSTTTTTPTPPPAPVVLVSTTSEPSLVTNPLFADANADGTPDGWFLSGAATSSISTDAAVTGNVVTLTRTATTGTGALNQNVTTGFVAGDVIEFGIKYNIPATGPVVNIYALCSDAAFNTLLNTFLLSSASSPTAGFITATARFTVPANTTRIQFYMHTASGTGTAQFGQATLRKKV